MVGKSGPRNKYLHWYIRRRDTWSNTHALALDCVEWINICAGNTCRRTRRTNKHWHIIALACVKWTG